MRPHQLPQDTAEYSHNTARFFVEHRHISWVLLVVTLAWGLFAYYSMPHRKDPEIPIRVAVAMCAWQGVSAEKIEELVTRKLETKIAENEKVERVESSSRTGLAVVTVHLLETVNNTSEVFDDINLKLNDIRDLPQGAGPVVFIKDFGDTAALMLTVASPRVGELELELRAREAETVLRDLRGRSDPKAGSERVAIVAICSSLHAETYLRRKCESLIKFMEREGVLSDAHMYASPGLAMVDAATSTDDNHIQTKLMEFIYHRLRVAEINPDVWWPVLVRDPSTLSAKLAEVTGSKYTFRELEAYTDEIARTLQTVPLVSKVVRWGVQNEGVFLEYSQERLASYGIHPWRIREILAARNIRMPGGIMEVGGKNLIIDPSGEFKSDKEVGDAIVSATGTGVTAYLRDLVDIERGYQSPPENLNFLTVRNGDGQWERLRAITLAVNMRAGGQIGVFSSAVDEALGRVRVRLPEDLIVQRTSDQPRQVDQSVNLFMRSLHEAIILVVLVSLVGFWEWRSAVLMALSIPITLALTFGMMHLLGVDLQQVSIGSLIVALGLLVDDPVVANDAIRNELDQGKPRQVAAWLGPTKLAKAILYATITNIVAYLPYLLLKGDTGRFLFTLPVVMTCSLVASRIVSMTFVPLLGYHLLRPHSAAAAEGDRAAISRFARNYQRLGGFLIDHRWTVFFASLLVVVVGIALQMQLKPQFFPKDLSYLAYVDLWLPEDAPITSTDAVAIKAEGLLLSAAAEFGAQHPDKSGKPLPVLKSVTTFVGGGGPRFWYSVEPELSQPNYAQILFEVTNEHLTETLVHYFQNFLMPRLPGAKVDVRQLESGPPVGFPVQVRLSGEDQATLRNLSERLKTIFRDLPNAYRVKDNWGAEIFQATLRIDPDKANMAGVTNMDVAMSSASAMNGFLATNLFDGRLTIPVVVRLRMEERVGVDDIENLYIYSADTGQKVPLGQISTVEYGLETEKICRRNHFRTVTVSCAPIPGVLPSEVILAATPKLREFERTLPPGHFLAIGGEHEEQVKGFSEMNVILVISVLCIYVALLFQFRNAVKPLLVFAALPYGMTGAFASLWIMGLPFGFMAFLGIISLIGVIVSHIIVLFDFIDVKREEGADWRSALLEAGVMRLRPVLVTVGATVFALFPLAMNGGPLWEPLCYAQIGGLIIATVVTLLMVPVLYAIAVFDLKIVK